MNLCEEMRLVYYRNRDAPRVWIRCVPTHKIPVDTSIDKLIPIFAVKRKKTLLEKS